MPALITIIISKGAKITIHFIAPVNKNCIKVGLDATSMLTNMLLTTAKNMLLYTLNMAELICEAVL
jgi:hypothetical protein